MQIWDDEIKPYVKRGVGRPVQNPFPSDEMEREFVACGKAMIAQYFKPEPNTKRDFVFTPQLAMSKTMFWSLIYIHYTEVQKMHPNLQGFLLAVVRHFGPEVSCDRASILKSVKSMNALYVHSKHLHTYDDYRSDRQEKYRSMYQYLVGKWKSVG